MTVDVKKELGDKMRLISSNVTLDDKKAAIEKFDKVRATIASYLEGDVKDVDFGIELLEFFHGRIKERLDRINAIA